MALYHATTMPALLKTLKLVAPVGQAKPPPKLGKPSLDKTTASPNP